VDGEWCNQWASFLKNETGDSPYNYVSDDVINEKFNKGQILEHKKDFYLIPDGKLWSMFSRDFVYGIIILYEPSQTNRISYQVIDNLVAKAIKNEPEISLAMAQQKQQDELSLIQKNKKIVKARELKKDKSFKNAQQKREPAFLDLYSGGNGELKKSANGEISRTSNENKSNTSSYEPEFLKDSKISVEDQDEESKEMSKENEITFTTPSRKRGYTN
jgi:hypothetical protein